jgi:hypothetical protein
MESAVNLFADVPRADIRRMLERPSRSPVNAVEEAEAPPSRPAIGFRLSD